VNIGKTDKSSEKKAEQNELTNQLTLDIAKESLDEFNIKLKNTVFSLPSLVTTIGTNHNGFNEIFQDKVETDIELISMLEDFFAKMVLLLRYRTAYDQQINQISKHVIKLKNANTLSEFRGILQLLGITLIDTEKIIKNYEELYRSLFTEQALLQFQLMEQLSMFRESNIPNFKELFNTALNAFQDINEMANKEKEKEQ